MLDDVAVEFEGESRKDRLVILRQKAVKSCHIMLPDTPKPLSALSYGGKFYSYVKCFSTLEAAKRGAGRLIDRNNIVLLTQVTKGFVLWVLEPDAQLATKSFIQ